MTELFLQIVDMSIQAGWLVLAVLVLRLGMKKAPKWVHVLLWGIVAIRLICPVLPESPISLMQTNTAQEAAADLMDAYVGPSHAFWDDSEEYAEAVLSGIQPVYGGDGRYYVMTGETPTTEIPRVADVAAWIWIVGAAAMALYTAVSYLRLRRKVNAAVKLRDNIYVSDRIPSPFVLGLFRPRIYLPSGMDGGDMSHVIAHEQTHIRRRDHWWKPLGFLLLSIHWFNPLMWAAYVMLCRDIELACDERVIRDLGRDARADYSQALLKCSVGRRTIAACPLAFGEVGVRARVKNVLSYQKPGFWIVVLAVVVCMIVAVTMLTDPMRSDTAGKTLYYGTLTEYDAGTLRLDCEDGSSLVFRVPETVEIDAGLTGGYVSVRGYVEEETETLTASAVKPAERTGAEDLDAAILGAILRVNASERYEDHFQCAAYEMIHEKTADGGKQVTVYIHALHHIYSVVESRLEEYAGSYIPTVLTFRVDEAGEYQLSSCWTPRDGAYYAEDIRAKFGIYADEALDGQSYYHKLNRRCYIQALAAYADAEADGSSLSYSYTDSADLAKPTVTLYPGGEFFFTFSSLSSYIGHGTYEVGEKTLTLRTGDGAFVYVFDIHSGGLVFDGAASSDMVWFSDLTDGAVLEPSGGSIIRREHPVVGETYVTSACLYMSYLSSYYPWGGDSGFLYSNFSP